MPDGAARVSVVGHSEFGAVALMEELEEWGFYYVLRQKSSHLVCCERCSEPHRPRREWRALGELIERRGERVWLEGAFLSRLHAHRTNLVLYYWKRGEKEPWLCWQPICPSAQKPSRVIEGGCGSRRCSRTSRGTGSTWKAPNYVASEGSLG
jgi:hypothetical protein